MNVHRQPRLSRGHEDGRVRADTIALAVCVAAFLAFFVWVFQGTANVPPEPEVLPRVMQVAAAIEPIETAPVPVREWVPDGRIWVRVANPKGSRVTTARMAWVDGAPRSFDPGESTSCDGEGWFTIDAPAAGLESGRLAVAATGFATAWLLAPDPRVRHEVQLQAEPATTCFAVDAATGRKLGDVQLRASMTWFEGEPWEGHHLPGPDAKTAIHQVVSKDDGVLAIQGLVPGTKYHFQVRRKFYILGELAPTQLLGGRSDIIDLQMPLVGAIQYVGDRLFDGSVQVGGRQLASRIRSELWRAQKDVAGDRQDCLAVALLPDRERKAAPKAVATFHSGAKREDRMTMVPWSEFAGPQEIRVEPGNSPIHLSKVRLLPPDEVVNERDRTLKVMVSESGGGRRRTARLGDTIELPTGRYSVGVIEPGAPLFERTVYEVKDGHPADFQLSYLADARRYRLVIESGERPRFVQLRVERNGVGYVLDGVSDPNGVVTFWSKYDYESGRVYCRGFEQFDIVFTQRPGTNVYDARCRLQAN